MPETWDYYPEVGMVSGIKKLMPDAVSGCWCVYADSSDIGLCNSAG
jgi:hypothetical protein